MGEDQGGESKESEVASSFVRCPPLPRRSRMNLAFERHIGIDYSGAETPKSSLKGLRVYAADRLTPHRKSSRRRARANTGVAGALLSGWLKGSPKETDARRHRPRFLFSAAILRAARIAARLGVLP